jgi:TPR repeat protein
MNKSLAAQYLKSSGDQGDAHDHYCDGRQPLDREGVSMHKLLAGHYVKSSAEQRYAQTQFSVGFQFLRGEGVSMNKSLAAAHFKFSADQGRNCAQVQDHLHLLRVCTKPSDLDECESYLRRTVAQGSHGRRVRLGICLFCGIFGQFDLNVARS